MLSGHRLFFDSGRPSYIHQVSDGISTGEAGYLRLPVGTVVIGQRIRLANVVGCVFSGLRLDRSGREFGTLLTDSKRGEKRRAQSSHDYRA